MNLGLESYYAQFDACVKTGQCKGSAKLVSLVSNFDSPSPGIAQAFSFTTFSPRRVSCSLSAGPGSDKSGGTSNTSLVLVAVSISAAASPRPRLSTQRTEASPCAVRTRDNRTNGRTAIRKEVPASQQRVSPSGLTTFPPAGKSGLSPGKRYTSERLWCVIRRASQSSLNSYPIDIGYGALTEQARMTGSTPNPNKKGYGSVAGITEQGLTSTCTGTSTKV